MNWDWKKFYDRAYDWIILYGPRIILAIVVFLVGLWIVKMINRWIKKGFEKRKHFNPSLRYFLQNLVAISLQILLVFFSLQVAGIQLTFFAAIVAGLSVAIGLALSGTLQNFVSGILILVLRPYAVGENVVMQGQEGTVTSIQLFYTTILTFDNKTIIVPNGQLSNNVIVNLSRQGRRRLDISMKLPHAAPFEKVREIAEAAMAAQAELLKDPKARVGIDAIEFDKYEVVIQVWVNAHGFEDSKYILKEKLMKELRAAGIIAAPK